MKPASLRIDVITTFIAIVEAGSMREAGRRLGISKSVVSQRLSALEAALGVRLLSRSTRQQALTDRGRYFFDRCQKVVEEFQAAAEEICEQQDELGGTIRIAAPVSFARLHLGGVFSQFLCANPLIDLQIDFDDRVHDLVGDSYDMAIRIGRLKNSALIMRRFGHSHRVVVCSPRYIAENGKPETVDDLENHYAVSYANITPQSEWIFRRGQELKSVTPKSRMRVNSGDIQLAAVKAGVAIAALPLFIVHEAITKGEIELVNFDWQLVPDDLCIIYPQNRFLPRKVRALSAAIIAHVGSPPYWESSLSAEQQERLKS